MKWSSSGRKVAQRCVVSTAASSFVTGAAAPPEALILKIGLCHVGEKMIVPSLLHDPGRPPAASQSDTGTPPVRSTFFSLSSAKNAMKRLSGDQNGNVAVSVPAIGRA